jgi:hypothetical protein
MAVKSLTGKEYDMLKENILQYVNVGFIGMMSESESQEECLRSLDRMFKHFESIKPNMKIKKKVVLKGYENDIRISDAVFNIRRILESYDLICSEIGYSTNHKSSAINVVSAKLICQRMKIALIKFNSNRDIASDTVESAVERMFKLISTEEYWRGKFSLQYLEKAFDSAFNASISISNKMKTNVVDIVNLETYGGLL